MNVEPIADQLGRNLVTDESGPRETWVTMPQRRHPVEEVCGRPSAAGDRRLGLIEGGSGMS